MIFDDSYRAFLFAVYPEHGMLLLYTTRKKSKGPHYQIPGGHIEQADIDHAAKMYRDVSGTDSFIHACKIGVTRELYEETGIDLRSSLNRLRLVNINPSKLSAPNEITFAFKKRVFFSVELMADDFHIEVNYKEGMTLTKAQYDPSNRIPSTDVMLRLSEEHQGFTFEPNLLKAVDLLKNHSGGKVSSALKLTLENGEMKSFSLDTESSGKMHRNEELQPPFPCNELIKRELDMTSCNAISLNDCHRTFYVFFPEVICRHFSSANASSKSISSNENNEIQSTQQLSFLMSQMGTLPLIFAVHCYGCTHEVMKTFIPYANSHNVIFVLPEGIQNSFNALHCCGYALNANIDDVGFFSDIQSRLEDEYPFVQSNVSYAVGWSNGGFMVTYAANLFRAISPISGNIYDINSEIIMQSSHNVVRKDKTDRGKGIFIHQSLNDPFIQSKGCCHDPKAAQCCCDVAADTCVPVQEVLLRWASEINGCGVIDNTSTTSSVKLGISFEDKNRKISCSTATDKSCISNATLCLYEDSGHFNYPSFGNAFPMAEQVVDFFAKDACSIHNGIWENSGKFCQCKEGSGYEGLFCLGFTGNVKLQPKDQLHIESQSNESKHQFTLAILILTFAGLFIIKYNSKRNHRKIHNGSDSKNDQSELKGEENVELLRTRSSQQH